MEWRVKGSQNWHPDYVAILDGDTDELVLIALIMHRVTHYTCATCGKQLAQPYVLHGPVPRSAESDRRYCIEHPPIPIEIKSKDTEGEQNGNTVQR